MQLRLLQRPVLHLLRYSPTVLPSATTTTVSLIPNRHTAPVPQQTRTMSDDAYAAFLAKQNRDYSQPGSEPTPTVKATFAEPSNPKLLAFKKEERIYTSDADEPFVPVKLEWCWKELPSGGEFSTLVQAPEEAMELKVEEWDPKGQYKDVISAVKAAGQGTVGVYVVGSGARVEYFVVTVSEEGLVGVRAKAVET